MRTTTYSPSTRAEDISRLLDPSYSAHSYSHSVYVDHNGTLHDPDYRDFSPIPSLTAHSIDADALSDNDDYDVSPEDNLIALQHPFSFPYRRPHGYYYTPDPSSPTSYDSTHDFPLEEKPRRRVVKRPRPSRPSRPSPPSAVLEEDADERATADQDAVEKDLEWTPTCAQSMRRQWQAISLRFKFALFNAQRRFRRYSLR